MQKTIAVGIAAGGVAAMLLMARSAGGFGGVILVYMAPLPLFYAGLTLGMTGMGIASLTGSILSLLMGVDAALLFVLGFAVPVGVLVRQALQPVPAGGGNARAAANWTSPGQLVLWLAVLAAVLFGLAMLLGTGHDGGLIGILERRLQPLQDVVIAAVAGGPGNDQAVRAGWMTIIRLLPGMTAMVWMMIMAVNGALAQGVAIRFGQNLRPTPDMAALVLPRGLSMLLAAALLAATAAAGTPGFIGLTLACILVAAFVFQGLGVVHALVRRSSMPGLMLVLSYVGFVVVSGLLVLLAILGLVEEWVGIRRRIAVAPSDQERK